jgi:hypothetical protein
MVAMLLALRRLLLQGVVRVSLSALAVACTVGFFYEFAIHGAQSHPTVEALKGCMPSHCRPKVVSH